MKELGYTFTKKPMYKLIPPPLKKSYLEKNNTDISQPFIDIFLTRERGHWVRSILAYIFSQTPYLTLFKRSKKLSPSFITPRFSAGTLLVV